MTKPEPRRTGGPPRRLKPRSPDLTALAQAIEALVAPKGGKRDARGADATTPVPLEAVWRYLTKPLPLGATRTAAPSGKACDESARRDSNPQRRHLRPMLLPPSLNTWYANDQSRRRAIAAWHTYALRPRVLTSGGPHGEVGEAFDQLSYGRMIASLKSLKQCVTLVKRKSRDMRRDTQEDELSRGSKTINVSISSLLLFVSSITPANPPNIDATRRESCNGQLS